MIQTPEELYKAFLVNLETLSSGDLAKEYEELKEFNCGVTIKEYLENNE